MILHQVDWIPYNKSKICMLPLKSMMNIWNVLKILKFDKINQNWIDNVWLWAYKFYLYVSSETVATVVS